MKLNDDFKSAIMSDETAFLEKMPAEERILQILNRPGERVALTTSFGIQSAVLLHMVSSLSKDTPIVFIDTQHLHHETYRYKKELCERLGLEIQTYRADMSEREQFALYGARWENHQANDAYKWQNKKEPMQRAIKELGITSWISGLRRAQSERRAGLPVMETDAEGIHKIYPLIDWSETEIIDYMNEFSLPFHPLSYEGYRTIGDFFEKPDIRPECGLHVPINYEI